MIQHDLDNMNDAATGERATLAKSASDPLDRRDLARLLYGYLAGTAAIAVFGSVLLAAEVYPRPEHTTMEKLLLWTVMLSIPLHIPALLVIHRLDKAGLQRFATWILFTSSFLLTALIHLSGTYTAIVGILIFTEIGMATLILAPRTAGLLVLLQFLQFAAIVVLEKLGVIPRQTILLELFNFNAGNMQMVAVLALFGGVLGTIFSWSTYVRKRFEEIHLELAALAVTDKLTGLPNRRSFDEALYREVARARRLGSPISMLMCDADHFKVVNDTYGHGKGDEVLRRIADVLLGSVRVGVDQPARIGGEEFAIILSDSSLSTATEVAERIVETMRQLRFEAKGEHFRVTLSIGVTSLQGTAADGDLLIEATDVLLYRAKNGGRNQVVAMSVEDLQGEGPAFAV
ncbi:MAG: GGDEF domain-containing protein [Chrysiogenetes bacterium]|nr:GGDEF domain-containing protein [Chrysiogenetes bacterium]